MRSCCQRWFSEACGTSSAYGVPRRAAASNRSLRTGTTCKLLRPSSAETGDTHRVYIYRHLKYARVACEFWLRLLEATRCCGADRHSRAAASAVLSRRGWKLRRRSQSLADALRVRWIRVGACSHLHDVTRHNRGHTLGVPTTSHTEAELRRGEAAWPTNAISLLARGRQPGLAANPDRRNGLSGDVLHGRTAQETLARLIQLAPALVRGAGSGVGAPRPPEHALARCTHGLEWRHHVKEDDATGGTRQTETAGATTGRFEQPGASKLIQDLAAIVRWDVDLPFHRDCGNE